METSLIVACASAFLTAVIGEFVRRSSRRMDRLEALPVDLAVLKARVDTVQGAHSDLKNELCDIRDHMVRRADLDALSKRIDDLIEILRERA